MPADLLGRSALVGVDVRGLGADDRPQRGSIDCSPRTFAPVPLNTGNADAVPEVPAHDLLQALGVHVLAVGDLVPAVRRGDRREHLGVHARVVVGGEAADAGVVQSGHDPSI